MKKQLFLTTAIVGGSMLLVAGQASAQADLRLRGFAKYQFYKIDQDIEERSDGDIVRDYSNQMDDVEFHIRPQFTADNGLEYGANLELELGTSGSDNSMDEAWVYMSGNWGEIQFGETDGMTDSMPYTGDFLLVGPAGYDGDVGDVFNFQGSAPSAPDLAADTGDRAKIAYYTPRFAGFQAGVSLTPDGSGHPKREGVVDDDGDPLVAPGGCGDSDSSNIVQFGVNYVNSFNGIDVGIGGAYSNGEADLEGCEDPEGLHVGGTVEFSGFGIGGSYGDNFDTGQTSGSGADAGFFWEVAGSYSMGPWAVGVGYFHSEADTGTGDDENDIISVNGAYTVAPGLQLVAEYNNVESDPADPDDPDNDGDLFIFGVYVSF